MSFGLLQEFHVEHRSPHKTYEYYNKDEDISPNILRDKNY